MKRNLLLFTMFLTSILGFSQNAILSYNSPASAVPGTTITVSFNYTALAAGSCQIQLYKTDTSGNINYSAGVNGFYFTDAVPAAVTSTVKSTTFTVPNDAELSNTLPTGVVYKWFFKLTVGGTDYYTSNPEMAIVSSGTPPVIPYKITLDTPSPITVEAGKSVTIDYTYSAPATVGGEFQVYKTDSPTIWGGTVTESLPITQYPSLVTGSDVKTTVTLAIPSDLPLSSSLPLGVHYRIFGKLAAAANGSTDQYWSYPELIVIANLSVKNFNENGVKVIYNSQSKSLVFTDDEPTALSIYDVKGLKILSLNKLNDNKTIDVSSFASGMYFLKNEKGSAFKFIVN